MLSPLAIYFRKTIAEMDRGGGEMRLINSVPVSVSVWLKTQIFSLHLEQENNEGGDISKIYTLN